MPGFFKKIVEFFKNMQKGQRVRLIILVSVIIVIVIAVSAFLNQKDYTVLYSGMDSKDAGDVMAKLEELGVDAVPRGEDTIMVEKDQADKIRMQLSAEGYPASGFNFDIFEKAAGLGTTDMEKQKYYGWQLSANISQTIKKMDKVEDCVVNINLSDESPFALSETNKPASAAVMLTLKNSQKLNQSEVNAIGELVSKSVSGLKLEDVRIIDSKMNLYKIQDEDEIENVGTQLELQNNIQSKLKQQIINLLTPVFGEGKVLAEVNVTLNFDKKTTETVEFAPPSGGTEGLAVSMKELAETVKNGANGGGVSGVDSNGGASQYPALTDEDAVYNKISKETNLEVNETRTQIENAKGQIRDLSVAVVLDSSEEVEDYTENVKSLVANAIGVNSEKITVDRLPFKKLESTEVEDAMSAQKEMLTSMQGAETTRLIILALAGLAVMFMLLAIVKTLRKKKPEIADQAVQRGGIDYVAGEEIIPEPMAGDVQFEAKDTNISQLENYIDKSPESVAQLLRNWLSEDYGR